MGLSEVLVTQSCPTLCNLIDCSPPGSSIHGILQARILQCVAIPFFRGFFRLRDRTWVSCTAVRFCTVSAIWAAHGVRKMTFGNYQNYKRGDSAPWSLLKSLRGGQGPAAFCIPGREYQLQNPET